ncbi:hypothetical protein NJLHNGOC_11335 [Novacetimonas cocois]|uniref:Uncharacterized protein n=1 Tax=Novacetimonas cocois TaxID=1747507 RepID=A0A365YTC5_9PROT|nr:hypothetical protein NJLHNGOC_11335 [Novacetimonas cocois]
MRQDPCQRPRFEKERDAEMPPERMRGGKVLREQGRRNHEKRDDRQARRQQAREQEPLPVAGHHGIAGVNEKAPAQHKITP